MSNTDFYSHPESLDFANIKASADTGRMYLDLTQKDSLGGNVLITRPEAIALRDWLDLVLR